MGVTKKVWLGSYRQTGAGSSSSSKAWPKQLPAMVAVAGYHKKRGRNHSRGDNGEVTIHSRGVTGAATGGQHNQCSTRGRGTINNAYVTIHSRDVTWQALYILAHGRGTAECINAGRVITIHGRDVMGQAPTAGVQTAEVLHNSSNIRYDIAMQGNSHWHNRPVPKCTAQAGQAPTAGVQHSHYS